MKAVFLDRDGTIARDVHCRPHHPDDHCDCRRPKIALFLRAARELNLDFHLSYVVGDMQMDIDAGKALGCKTILVTTGSKGANKIVDPPDCIAESLLEAARWIVEHSK